MALQGAPLEPASREERAEEQQKQIRRLERQLKQSESQASVVLDAPDNNADKERTLNAAKKETTARVSRNKSDSEHDDTSESVRQLRRELVRMIGTSMAQHEEDMVKLIKNNQCRCRHKR